MSKLDLVSLKIEWQGTVISIQPRTRVWRYLTDNCAHYYLGYNLFLDGTADGYECRFGVAISEKQQITGGFRIGDLASGTAAIRRVLRSSMNVTVSCVSI